MIVLGVKGGIASSKLRVCYGIWTIEIDDLPTKMVIFQFAMLNYQRVIHINVYKSTIINVYNTVNVYINVYINVWINVYRYM